jgi:hypothetical protein
LLILGQIFWGSSPHLFYGEDQTGGKWFAKARCLVAGSFTDAVTHQIHEQLEADFQQRHLGAQKALAEREKQLGEQQAGIEKARRDIEMQVAQKLTAERSKLSATALAEAKLSLGVEMQDLRDRLAERQTQLQQAQKTELELRKRESAQQSRTDALELEVARKLHEERTKRPPVSPPTPGGREEQPGPPTPPTPPAQPKPKRFYGTVRLDPSRVGRDASRIADEVISHLVGQDGAEVTVTLEIDAKLPNEANDQLVRIVTENSRTLKFDSHGFEKE